MDEEARITFTGWITDTIEAAVEAIRLGAFDFLTKPFHPTALTEVVRAALAPFEDLGVAGAMPSTSRAVGGTDSTSFSNAGLAGIGLQQDPIEYQSHTWHTNLDTYERIVPEDARQAAIVIAAAVWHVSNRDQPLPRFTKDQMPPPVAARP